MENPQSRKTEIPAIMLAKPNSGFEKNWTKSAWTSADDRLMEDWLFNTVAMPSFASVAIPKK